MLILCFSYPLISKLQELLEADKLRNQEFQNSDHINCTIDQMKSLSVLYLIIVTIDWIVIIITNNVDVDDEIICYQQVYVIAEGYYGSLFIACYDIFIYAQSIMIWNIFYRIPKSYGFLLNKKEPTIIVNPSSEDN